MAIAASGAVSFSDLRTEFVGGSSAISFSDLYRGGSNIKTKEGDNPATNLAASVPASGTIDIGDFHGTAKGFKATISSSTTNVNINTLFGGDYDTDYPKVVDINSGITIGGSGDEAIDIPSGLASTLTINNAGNVLGFGGATGGGAGGAAINCASSGVTINNTGLLAGGGGGGGTGGTGGNGTASSSTVQQAYSCHTYIYCPGGTSYWAGTQVPERSDLATCSYTADYSYYGYCSYCAVDARRIKRTCTTTTNTTGGSGGSGGVGQGYNVTNASGASGASGGTNAGTGGTGGAGATYGTAGATGSTGANGNSTNGSSGTSGGAAGAAVTGTSVTMNNSGTLAGAVA